MDTSQIQRVRSFNRAVKMRIGVLSDDFLGRGRPLAETRVLFEIGREGADVRALRAPVAGFRLFQPAVALAGGAGPREVATRVRRRTRAAGNVDAEGIARVRGARSPLAGLRDGAAGAARRR